MKVNYFYKSIIALFCCTVLGYAQDPTPTPPVVGEVTVTTKYANSDPLYQKIRQNLNVKNLSGEVATVNNLVLKKDQGTFTLKTGEIYFLAPVEGRVTGAVFIGDGEFSLVPPVEDEKKSLALLTDAPEIKETFSQIVMYFSDKTFDEVKNSPNVKMSATGPQVSAANSALQDKGNILKKRFRLNMSARILADFLTPQRQGFFVSLIDGKKYGKLVYQIDPLGIPTVYPEQVAILGYEESNFGYWTSFHMADEYKKGTANSSTDRRFYDITNHKIDSTIQGQKLIASDELTIKMREPDIKFIPFDLYGSLRVKTVKNEAGEEISFIQEKKDEDADFSIILATAPEANKPFKITVEYEGNDVVNEEGKGNYILNPSARSTWYPNNPFTAFGDRALFDLTFHYPKIYTLVGVGSRIGQEIVEGNTKTSKWTSDGIEYEVAGFNYGDFKSKIISDPSGYDLEVFANHEVPDDIRAMQNQIERDEQRQREGKSGQRNTETTLGALSTVGGMDTVLSSAQNSMRLYNAYFGKLPYKRIAMTQQPAGNFGQAWTTLVYMPYTAYFGSVQRSQMMGMAGGTSVFWTEVAPHELAHQWWGHIVGWKSYRDQWMSEGFATFSASLYIQYVQKDIEKFNSYWEIQRSRVVQASPRTKGLKPYLAGPLTKGLRLNNAKTGSAYTLIVYPKGAYILHMLRMMMAEKKEGDAKFQTMMRDFTTTYFNKPISTEDFKTIVEKHMTPKMDIDKNGKMDWFFDEWVYGTEMPSYKLEYNVDTSGERPVLSGKITQSGVSDNFAMIVPLYLDFGNGWISAGSVTVVGNKTFDLGKIPLPQAPKKVAICALSDVLAANIENVKK